MIRGRCARPNRSSRNLRPNTCLQSGSRQAIRADQRLDNACSSASSPLRSKRLNCPGTTVRANPTTPIPVARVNVRIFQRANAVLIDGSSSSTSRRLHRSRLRPVQTTAFWPRRRAARPSNTGGTARMKKAYRHASSPPIDTAIPPTSSGPSSPIGRPTPSNAKIGTAPGSRCR